MSSGKRAIRIAGCSGSASDRRHAMAAFAAHHAQDPVDVIMGDFLSEANMTSRGASKSAATAAAAAAPTTGATSEQRAAAASAPAYEPSFLESLVPALEDIARHRIKVAVNAGASDTQLLFEATTALVESRCLDLKVAWISGDEVLPAVQAALASGGRDGGAAAAFTNISTGQSLGDWGFDPVYAQAYLGGLGIAEAFRRGADIVVCGRVSDASPVIGAAAWWHGWGPEHIHELANAFVAGHLIECSNYVCGGNFSGFKALEGHGWEDVGYPIAEIGGKGEVVVAKSVWGGGEVTVDTCSSQLLYEIQGPWYFNSDVTAILDDIWFERLEANRVAVRGVKGDLPPPTTKIGLTARGGFQAEFQWFLTGLDIEEKARMVEAQSRRVLEKYSAHFTKLLFSLIGSVAEDPEDQNAATVIMRILAQAKELSALAPQCFLRPLMDNIMQGYPGATPHLDLRMAFPKPIYEYFVSLLPQSSVNHRVHLWDGEVIDVSPPTKTKVYSSQQPDIPESTVTTELDFGPTTSGPLGWLVHARSGDKGSNANVGFWVRHEDEYQWLRWLLSTDKLRQLLGDEYKEGKKIDRFELKNMRAVHFLLHDHLDRGVSCSSTYDFLGKNVAEFLRARRVDLPVKFLDRGKL